MILDSCFIFPPEIGVDDYHLDERWSDLGNGYCVSDYGRIWSAKKQKFLKSKRLDKYGHVGICICLDDGKRVYRYLHRLVAEEFIPNPNNYPIVRHLNNNPKDNTVDNLAWGTQADNIHDCIENGRNYELTDEDREQNLVKIRKPIISYNLDTGEIIHHKSISEAAICLGLWSSNIQKVLHGERKHTGRYYFELEK